MGKFLCNIPDDRLETLRSLSSATGTPVSEYIRRAVDSYLCPAGGQLVVSGSLISGCVVLVMRGG